MGTLYIIASPIGNLEDITLRALKILKEVDLIACEDTRVSRKLLSRYSINKPLVSYHEYSRLKKIDYILRKIKEGKSLALVSDSGTPCISDPGSKLIRRVWEEYGKEAKIIPIPGPSALAAAASVSGFDVNRFLFLGFLPRKKNRKKLLEEIAESKRTVVFYESPHRILKTLTELKDLLVEERKIVLCCELTKKFERIYRGNTSQILKELEEEKRIRGEFVVLVERKKE